MDMQFCYISTIFNSMQTLFQGNCGAFNYKPIKGIDYIQDECSQEVTESM